MNVTLELVHISRSHRKFYGEHFTRIQNAEKMMNTKFRPISLIRLLGVKILGRSITFPLNLADNLLYIVYEILYRLYRANSYEFVVSKVFGLDDR